MAMNNGHKSVFYKHYDVPVKLHSTYERINGQPKNIMLPALAFTSTVEKKS